MFFLSGIDARSRHLFVGVLSIMLRDDFFPDDKAAPIPEGLNPLWIASRVWALSDRKTGFPVIFDTVASIVSSGYIRRSIQTKGKFRFRRGSRVNIHDWLAENLPADTSLPTLPDPLFQFFRYTVRLPDRLRELALRTTGVIASVIDTVRVCMVEVSPFGEGGIAMMSRIDGPDGQYASAGAAAAGLEQDVNIAMSGWRYELSKALRANDAFRLDPLHSGVSVDVLRRIAEGQDINGMLSLGNAPFEPVLHLRKERNQALVQASTQFRNLSRHIVSEMGNARRAGIRENGIPGLE